MQQVVELSQNCTGYKVVKLVNRLEPEIGEKLSKQQIRELISNGVKVIIKPSND